MATSADPEGMIRDWQRTREENAHLTKALVQALLQDLERLRRENEHYANVLASLQQEEGQRAAEKGYPGHDTHNVLPGGATMYPEGRKWER